ncbi:unnamed protein product [Miscanthus lutarioriparius]|uniref:ATP-dependent DNA helicase n=1 Tax=Miscanthus lutarioriparius TaxID=422564 RepID=A0A811MNI6_9POAL|nr:unnamed protein product [Miscanthus lutarioriparius]
MSRSGLPTDQVRAFNDWVLSIGDGTATGNNHTDDGDSELVEIPHDILVPKLGSPIDNIIRSTYPNLDTFYSDPNYLRERAIIAPKNDTINEINNRVLSLIPGHEKVYLSSDSLVETSKDHGNADLLYPVEFLNPLQFKGIPSHKLMLKVGSSVMLLRNLNQSAGLCNGTRLIITQLGDHVLEAQIITGSHIGDKVLLPRVSLHVSSTKWPFVLSRRQFPMEYTLVSQINPTRHNWTIKVRVARMWKLSSTPKWKGVTAMELVLVDEEGVGITACIGHKDLSKFADSLVEGRSYMIKKFQVSRQARKYSAVPNPQTIYFTPWTVVEEIPTELATQLPLYVFNFVDFEELTHRRRNGHGLVDVIGQLTVIHPVVRSSGLNGVCVRRVVELRDLSDHLLQIILWGEHATLFEDQILIETIDKDEPVVMVFAGVQVKQYLGATTCASGDGTKWYMNIDLPEMNTFRVSLQGRGSKVVFLPGDEAGANRKTVAELLALDPHDSNGVRFTRNAIIREIDVSNGWWYKGCNTCKRGLKATFEGFECTNCDEAKPVVIPSYKLSVIIEDTTGYVKIFLFGGVAEQAVRRTAAELVEESSSNQILLPASLRGLVGRRYVFQVVISEQTFRTRQLCFQARRVFPDPTAAEARGSTGRSPHDPRDPKAMNKIGTSSVASGKDYQAHVLVIPEVPNNAEGGSTPPPAPATVADTKTSSSKGKEVPSDVHEEHGTILGKRPRSARRDLLPAKKAGASGFNITTNSQCKSVTTDHFYARLYFEIWKRVAKQKMNFKDALDEVKDKAMWPFNWAEVKTEIETDNYKTYVAGIDKNLEEGDEAYWLIVEAVKKNVPRLKTYYDYAKKKLGIAEKLGLIPSMPHTDKAKVLYGDHHPLLLGYLDEQEQLHFQADPSFYPKGAKTSSGLS